MILSITLISLICILSAGTALPNLALDPSRNVSQSLFESLEELARIVDISYCVGSSGIHKPFRCLSRCKDFEGFELITTWNTGPLLSDSCGYIALSHPPHAKRVIVAFRGTYSIANTIADLSTVPAEYAPYPGKDNDSVCTTLQQQNTKSQVPPQILKQPRKRSISVPECKNCTVHSGFMTSWRNTRCTILPHVEAALEKYPDYNLTLVGHSLGGAVAALAALEFQARGYEPHVTTFGEPRVGNKGLNDYIDESFNLTTVDPAHSLFQRVTHVNDPVPLLPLEEWDYHMHAGEIFISKSNVPPNREDLHHCDGDEDPDCIAGPRAESFHPHHLVDLRGLEDELQSEGLPSIPTRYRLWQLFFAHRDYFWRLGLCIPGGDPYDWFRGKYSMMRMSNEL